MITEWMARTFVRNRDNTSDPKVRGSYVRLECWTSIAGNVVLGTVKLALGLLSGSIALTADAFHTYGDMVSSIVLLVGMKISLAPPDAKHPHGHGRAEALGTLVLGSLLLITAVEFAHPSFDRLRSHAVEPLRFGWTMVPVLLLFALFKEWMARFSSTLGRIISSDALYADAQHHRSDALATLLVVLSFICSELNMPRLDGLFGLGVAGFIGWAGFRLCWQMMSLLLGEAPTAGMVSEIVSAAGSVRGVSGVHGVEVHDYGLHKVACLHVEVTHGMNTEDSHEVATQVEAALRRRLALSAVVHIEVASLNPTSGPRAAVEERLGKLAASEPCIRGYHALHVLSEGGQRCVELHLALARGTTVETCHRLEHELASDMQSSLGIAKVNVHCEPDV